MRIYRFMSVEEFQKYLKGEKIEGRFVKGRACFLEENIPARKMSEGVKELTDLPLHFESKDLDGQMIELTDLLSDKFKDEDFDGKLKEFGYLTLKDFMSKVRENASAEVLVEFEILKNAEKEFDKVIRAYRDYIIEEIQSDRYSMEELRCISYKIDLENSFKNGVGVDTIEKTEFSNSEEALKELESRKNTRKEKDFREKMKSDVSLEEQRQLILNIQKDKQQTNGEEIKTGEQLVE